LEWERKQKEEKDKKGKFSGFFALFVLFAFFASTLPLTTNPDFEDVSSHQHMARHA
jgi:hypothetical protein